MVFVEEPELFLEGDCAADMGALLAISCCCWDDCSAPISLSFRFRTLLQICNYVILTFIFLGRFVVISLLLWSSVIPAGIEVPEIAQWCFLSSLGRMG